MIIILKQLTLDMLKTLEYSFCSIEVYPDYVISYIKKDFHLTPDKNNVLEDIASDYFKNRPFVYISHRKNSYSVDPSIYMQTSKIKNLVGFAVVAEVPLSKGNPEVGKLFFNDKPFEIFETIEEAKSWVNTVLCNEKG